MGITCITLYHHRARDISFYSHTLGHTLHTLHTLGHIRGPITIAGATRIFPTISTSRTSLAYYYSPKARLQVEYVDSGFKGDGGLIFCGGKNSWVIKKCPYSAVLTNSFRASTRSHHVACKASSVTWVLDTLFDLISFVRFMMYQSPSHLPIDLILERSFGELVLT